MVRLLNAAPTRSQLQNEAGFQIQPRFWFQSGCLVVSGRVKHPSGSSPEQGPIIGVRLEFRSDPAPPTPDDVKHVATFCVLERTHTHAHTPTLCAGIPSAVSARYVAAGTLMGHISRFSPRNVRQPRAVGMPSMAVTHIPSADV